MVVTPFNAILYGMNFDVQHLMIAILSRSTFPAQYFAQSVEIGCELPLRVEIFDDFPFYSKNRSCFGKR